ncbi:MAG: hypothetical protein C0501_08460 [Isosphaera sp.]|nr:hypothetical protein [Isosphaera sp.]
MSDPILTQPAADGTWAHEPAAGVGPPVAAAGPPGYELLDEVGRGGMGVVYRARDAALGRDVAVKVLRDRYGPGSAAAVRFVEEARITGQLQHPGIPAVYQVGAMAGGRPFLAMKLIRGRTLDHLLRAGEAVDVPAVFEGVCQAVGYAHSVGVVHRDLKPANVMVGAFGEVQVMDWGLAKVLTGPPRRQGPAADPEAPAARPEVPTARDPEGALTEYGSVLGTPAFMAPEQAAGESDRVGTRSDVFGLGAILCALLTGRPPFGGTAGEEVRRNAAAGRTEEALVRLGACGADPGLVALCRRCLAPDPADRPGTADEVAAAVAALRRSADDRARQAERDKLAAEVRAAEQAKRRRAVQWAAGAVAAVLLAGVAGTTAGLVRANAARADADTARGEAEAARLAEADQRRSAEDKAAEAGAVATFLEDRVFAAARPKGQDGGLGKDVTLRDAITASLPALGAGFADRPLVEARLRRTVGGTFYYLGEARAAAEQCERARAVYADRLGPDHPDALASAHDLANCYAALGRLADALRLREEVAAGRRRVLGPGHPDTLAGLQNLANSHAALGRFPEAVGLHEEVLAACRRVLPPDHPDTLRAMSNLAVGLAGLGRYADAVELAGQVLSARRRLLPPDHPHTLASLHNSAAISAAAGRHAEGLVLYEEALAGRRRVLGPDHPDTVASLTGAAGSSAAVGRHAEAVALEHEILAAHRRTLPADHPEALARMWEFSLYLAKLGRPTEAVPIIDECLSRAAGKAVDPRLVPGVFDLRARCCRAAADPDGCRATAVMWEALARPDPGSLYNAACWRAVAAGAYAEAGRPDEAAADADRAVGWLRKAVDAGWRSRAHTEADQDLEFLRGRDDFRKLVASLPYLAPPPRPQLER